ncbi:class I SAM-dependent methyltransferase [Phenylobacterium sp.]|uniref:class I SAM-dependent methyltransferase n=1 Tax=Phenylobacterium sp. TaxID=1871053 RepID=UPI0035648BCD
MAYLRLRRLIELAVLDRPGLAHVFRPRGPGAPRAAPAEQWDAHHAAGLYDGLVDPERRHHHHMLAGMIAERRPGARVLEIGCGQGAFYDSMRRLGPASYLGTDIAPRAIAGAQARFAQDVALGRAAFQVADGADLAPEARFDAIVIADCLEYLGPVRETLSRCGRLLAPGGVVGVTQWLASHPLALWRELKPAVTILDEAVVLAPWGGAWQVWTCRPAGVADG